MEIHFDSNSLILPLDTESSTKKFSEAGGDPYSKECIVPRIVLVECVSDVLYTMITHYSTRVGKLEHTYVL